MRVTLIACLLLCNLFAFSQNLSNKGKEFWVGYGHHQFMEPDGSPQNGMEMVLYFSAEQTANVKVTINNTTYVRNYMVPAGSVIASEFLPKAGTFDCRLYGLPPSFGGNGGEGLFDRGIHIESDVPIVAYAHIFGSASSGATMLMPVETYGYTYVSVNSQQTYAANCFSWVYVVAKENNTRIEITPSVQTRRGRAAGVPFTVDLQKGQIYQVVGALQSGSTGYELTGTKVTSVANASGQCYPIGVFAGSSRTAITCPPGGGGSGDNNMQQIFPFQAWGKRYLTAPTSNATAANGFHRNIYKIAVKDPATVVKKNGVVLTGLINNFYYTYESNTADYIEADKPILVAQFMSSSGSCGNSGNGDPEMMYISPLEQGIKRVGFYRNTRENITINYLTLIIPTAGLTSLTIDGVGSPGFSHSYAHPNLPGYSVVVKRWSPSAQAQCVVQSDSAFTAITYGLGSVESYGYNAGTLINNLAALTFIHNEADNTVLSHQYTCEKTPVEISMLVAYKPNKIVWRLSQLANVTPNADVTDLNPTLIDSTILPNGLKYYKYRLPGLYTFSQAGNYELPVQNTHPALENCNNTEEVLLPIVVKASPRADFTANASGCVTDTVHFSSPSASGNGYTLLKWNWEFPDGTTSTLQNPSKLFAASGTQSIKLKVISTEGCVGDTTKDIVIYNKPVTTFGIAYTGVCEGDTLTFTDTTTYAGATPVTSWYWDFGNGTTVNATNGNAQVVLYNTYGVFTVKHVVKVGSNACVSDTAFRTVTLYAKPQLGFTYPAGCLPVDGVVQFNSTTTAPDGQALAAYAWDFGDANATPANPNTSTAANPSHIYTAFGQYTIKYGVTTANGCYKDTTVNATFNLRPTLTYAALSALCENNPGTVSVANAAVTNGVTGTGVYRGPGTDAAGNFNAAAAGYGTHTIWYVFTSAGGCRDSISQTIRVFAKPVVSFTYPAGGCLPVSGLVQFTNGTTIGDGAALSYLWNFGDANATPGNPNTSTQQDPSHNFVDGTYLIKLEVTSANGCVARDSVNATFSLRPLLAYGALPAVCESVTGTISVAGATVTNGATGTGAYRGPGTDAAGNFSPSAAGSGTHTIWYVFTTNGGCKDSISQTVLVRAKPKAAFTFPAGGCLPVSGLVQFTNTSTISDGQALSYHWRFNDPNASLPGNPDTSVLQNPTHNFLEGTYNIKLTVTTANGCVKDTTIAATFSLRPQLTYGALPAVCESVAGTISVAGATVTNGATGTGAYRGPGTDAAGNFSPSAAGSGTHTIWYVFTTSGGCKDSISQTVLVRAKPKAAFTFPAGGCLPVSGLVQFTNTSTISDGQALSYHWRFNDPNASLPGNPDTSVLQNPTHNFLEGTYNIKLTVTTANGCVKDTTIAATFSVRPQLSYGAQQSVCQSVQGTVSVASAAVTNGVTGTGVYRGPGTNAAGSFSPSAAGAGTHTIWYVFTTNGGCKDSISTTIKVHPKPNAVFTATSDICQDQTATITDNSTIASGRIVNWRWDFGNGNSATYNNGNVFTISYASFNNYQVKLVAVSDSGCVSDTARQLVKVHALPLANFNLPAAVCMPQGVANFTNLSAAPDNATLNYQWDFGDGSLASAAQNPTHTYATKGPFTVRLAAISSFGCRHDTLKVLSAFFDKPVASFSVSPDTLCQGTDNVFTDLSTPADSIAAWNWALGDGSTSTLRHPVKRYAQPGKFNVQLTVTSKAGCVSDPAAREVIVYLQPVIDAGPSFVVPQGTLVTFNARANDSSSLTFRWTPATGLLNANVLRPSVVANSDQTYTLVATGQGDCTATDFLTVKILKPVKVPNAFTPNNDGTNDRWVLGNLADYEGATVEVFNRYGQMVYRAAGNAQPWDGTYRGSPLPVATYYYIIDLKNGFAPLKGSVTIIR